MIQPNELRLGNFVQTEKGYFFPMEHIPDTKFGDYSRIYPIPLTPEILEKAGFSKINHRIEGILYKRDWLKCTEIISGWEWRGGYISNGPKYLHQLQNLYFALTGEELQIEL